ncbi:DUF4376 domain-containing protein [Salinicola rhizosphaerae]|uniref:DUF4376 domain-containing protein n=1 Tax=Salinicola rhizosphaerae TaxID=1443141 RepID=A0ABQ3EFA6_9GAMM|nr:DUF4376 domain-containing protein [Salinicola rhizosphaerae]GHB32921.1 hypothetical protein GCM10009038_34830 [Salinicola rhizosphaerae]
MSDTQMAEAIEETVTLPNWRNPVANPDGTIDCEIEHGRFGWIPFTASAADVEALGPALHDAITLSGQEIPNRVTPIGEIADRKRAKIEAALSAALAAGMAYTLPDGTEDVIQTRPDQDEANLLGLAIEARDRRTAGETGAVMSLRAKSNAVYSLTPEQMIALTDAAKEFKQTLLAKSWQLKDAVSVAETAGDREAIEAVRWGE